MIRILLVAMLTLLSSASAQAQEWPTKSVRFIVGYPAAVPRLRCPHGCTAHGGQLKQPFLLRTAPVRRALSAPTMSLRVTQTVIRC